MKKLFMLLIFLSYALFTGGGSYAEEITAREWKIYYEHQESITRSIEESPPIGSGNWIYDKYNITVEELREIDEKCKSAPLTERQWKIYDEYTKKLQPIEDEYNKAENELKEKTIAYYGITEDKFVTIIATGFYYKYYLEPLRGLDEGSQKKYNEIKKIFEDYDKKSNQIEAREKQKIKKLQKEFGDKYNILPIAVYGIYIKGGTQSRD